MDERPGFSSGEVVQILGSGDHARKFGFVTNDTGYELNVQLESGQAITLPYAGVIRESSGQWVGTPSHSLLQDAKARSSQGVGAR